MTKALKLNIQFTVSPITLDDVFVYLVGTKTMIVASSLRTRYSFLLLLEIMMTFWSGTSLPSSATPS